MSKEKASTAELSEIRFAKFAISSTPIPDTRLEQSRSVEDQASAARLVLKEALAS